MVGDRLGVRGPDADIDHGDAAVVALLQVIGRHLRQPADGARVRLGSRRRLDVAGLDEGLVAAAAVRHHVARQGAELVDVELVVGEQHEILEMARARGRVVRQAGERIVDALRGEGRQREGLARSGLVGAVGDLVVGRRQVRRVEQVAQRHRQVLRHRRLDMGALVEGEMQRDRRVGLRHHHGHAVVLQDERDLVLQIVAEERRPRHGGGIGAGRGDVPVGEARIHMAVGRGGHAQHRIEGAEARVVGKAGLQAAETVHQEARVALVERGERVHRFMGVVVRPRLDPAGRKDVDVCRCRDSLIHAPL